MAPLSSAWDGWGLGVPVVTAAGVASAGCPGAGRGAEPPQLPAPELVSAWVCWEGVQPVPVNPPMGFAEGVGAVLAPAEHPWWGEGQQGRVMLCPGCSCSPAAGKTTPAGSYLCLEDQVAEVVTKRGVQLPWAHP